MKRRRTKVHLGDVFLAPFESRDAEYSTIWESEWFPKSGEKCFAMQIVGKSHYRSVIVALFDGVHIYGIESDSLDISTCEALAVIKILPDSLALGEFKRISNQAIPDDMPYMAYRVDSIHKIISPTIDGNLMVETEAEEAEIDLLPRFGFSASGSIFYGIAKKLILNEPHHLIPEDSVEREINLVMVRPGAEVWRYFPEAKDRNWILEQMASTRDTIKVTNLISAQSELIFGDTYYLIDATDEFEPYLMGKLPEEQDLLVDKFQKHFDSLLESKEFERLLSLIPYFSWLDLASYWDMNFSFMHAIEKEPEYTDTRMRAFYRHFSFRENDLVYDLKSRLREGPDLWESEMFLTYFPNTDSVIHEVYGDEINASLRGKIEEVASLNSAHAWANLIPLMDENYDNKDILDLIFEKQGDLPPEEKAIMREIANRAPMKNPLTWYWL